MGSSDASRSLNRKVVAFSGSRGGESPEEEVISQNSLSASGHLEAWNRSVA
jgi:hypothetical protein